MTHLFIQKFQKKNKDRKILMEQILRDEALEAFKIWENKTDKIKY